MRGRCWYKGGDGGSSKGGGGCEGGLTQVGGAVGVGGCIGVVGANGVGMIVGGGSVGNRLRLWVVEDVMVWVVEKLIKEILSGSLRLFESSGKTFHTVFHSLSISTGSLCFWSAWKEKSG